jgi:hypothetical protein
MGFSTTALKKKIVNGRVESKHAQHATETWKVYTIAREWLRASVEGLRRFPQVHSPYY